MKQLTATDQECSLCYALGGVDEGMANGSLRDLAQGSREFAFEGFQFAAVGHLLERGLGILGLDDPVEE